jgi:hypothetical protein
VTSLLRVLNSSLSGNSFEQPRQIFYTAIIKLSLLVIDRLWRSETPRCGCHVDRNIWSLNRSWPIATDCLIPNPQTDCQRHNQIVIKSR